MTKFLSGCSGIDGSVDIDNSNVDFEQTVGEVGDQQTVEQGNAGGTQEPALNENRNSTEEASKEEHNDIGKEPSGEDLDVVVRTMIGYFPGEPAHIEICDGDYAGLYEEGGDKAK